jgi:hypothetical protein
MGRGNARFAALLVVLLVIGLSGVARGNDGDPLILGHENTATRATWLNGYLGIHGSVFVAGSVTGNIQGVLHPWCAGIIRIPAGRRKGSSRFTGGDCNGLGLIATINGYPPAGTWVSAVRNYENAGQPYVIVYLNSKTPKAVSVAFMGVQPSAFP